MIQDLIREVKGAWGPKAERILDWRRYQVILGDEFQAHISSDPGIFLLWYNDKKLFWALLHLHPPLRSMDIKLVYCGSSAAWRA
jgi:hypothetical protein